MKVLFKKIYIYIYIYNKKTYITRLGKIIYIFLTPQIFDLQYFILIYIYYFCITNTGF